MSKFKKTGCDQQFPTQDEESSKADMREQKLIAQLKEGSRDDLVKDAGLLKKLGNVYFERGLKTNATQNFVYASALFNAAWLRNKDPGFRKVTEQVIRQTELAFCKVLGVKPDKLPIDFETEVKTKLTELRKNAGDVSDRLMVDVAKFFNLNDLDVERVAKECNFIARVRSLYGKVSDEVISFFRFLLSLSKGILGPPPQEYAVMGMGSLARGETTPYSDIEWSILVADDTKDVQYFRNLTRLTHFFVLNIRETLLKSMSITSLNDYDTPGGNWFVDIVTPRGFSYDSAAPYACDFPLGRPDRPGKQGREMIRTPYNMAKLCEYETTLKEGYHIDRVMATTVLIDGSEHADQLFEEFKTMRAKFKSTDKIRQKAVTEIRELIEEFYPKLSFLRDGTTVHDIKQELFRLPTIVISLFKTLFTLDSDTTWDILDEMKTKSLISEEAAHNLNCLVSIVTFLRMVVYSSKSHQNELISFLSPSPRCVGGGSSANVAYLANLKALIHRYYFTMQPFVTYLLSLQATVINHIKNDQKFFKRDDLCRGLIEMHFLSFPKARHHFFLYMEMLRNRKNCMNTGKFQKLTVDGRVMHYAENDVHTKECMEHIAEAYGKEGLLGPAIQISMQTLHMARVINRNEDHIDVLGQLTFLGELRSRIGACDLALRNLNDAKDMSERLFGNKTSHYATSILTSLGKLYYEMGKLDESLQFLKQAMSNMKNLTYHKASLAGMLNIIGGIYDSMDKRDLALQSYTEALEIYRLLHANGDHPKQAVQLNNIAEVYKRMGQFKLAIQYNSESLDMRKRLFHNVDNSYVARGMSNLGVLYRHTGDYEMALKYQRDSLDMRKRISKNHAVDPEVAYGLNNLGKVYQVTGKLDLALHNYKESLEMLKRIHNERDTPEIAFCLSNLSEVYELKENLTKALSYEMDALKILRRIHKHDGHSEIVQILSHISLLYLKLGRKDEALYHFKKVLGMSGNLFDADQVKEDHPETAKQLWDVGMICYKSGDYQLSLKNLTDSLHMYQRLPRNQHCQAIAFVSFEIAEIYSKLGQFGKALQYYKTADDQFTADNEFRRLHTDFRFCIFIQKWRSLIKLCNTTKK